MNTGIVRDRSDECKDVVTGGAYTADDLRGLLEAYDARQVGDAMMAACPLCQKGEGDAQRWKLRFVAGDSRPVLLLCRRCGPGRNKDVLEAHGFDMAALGPHMGSEEIGALWSSLPDWSALPDQRFALADEKTRDRVYNSLLAACPLTDEHRKWLEDRGADPTLYGTLPQAHMRGELNDLDPTFTVPGFTEDEGLAPGIPSGVLIPVRNLDGQIVAMKVRLTHATTNKMRTLTSRRHGGPSSPSVVHCPRGTPPTADVVRVLEGERNADVVFAATQLPTLAVPGVAHWSKSLPLLRRMRPKHVVLAFDQDDAGWKATVHALNCLADAGWSDLSVESWEKPHKGLDDALHAGAKVTRQSGLDWITPFVPEEKAPGGGPEPVRVADLVSESEEGDESTSPDEPGGADWEVVERAVSHFACPPRPSSLVLTTDREQAEYLQRQRAAALCLKDARDLAAVRAIVRHFGACSLALGEGDWPAELLAPEGFTLDDGDPSRTVPVSRLTDAPSRARVERDLAKLGLKMPGTVRDLRNAPPLEWVWKDFIAKRGATLLVAQSKSGKTTLFGHLLKNACLGQEMFERALTARRILLVSEEHETIWKNRFDEMGIFDLLEEADCVGTWYQPFEGKPTLKQWERFVPLLADTVKLRGYDLVVFDPVANLLPVADENSSTEMLQALIPLNQVKRAGAALLLLHHPSKGEASRGNMSRGSGALPGWVDTIIEMKALEGRQRHLHTRSRFSSPADLVAELSPDGDSYDVVDAPDVGRETKRGAIYDRLLTQPRTVEEIRRIWPEERTPATTTVHHDLKRLIEAGHVVKTEAHPATYHLASVTVPEPEGPQPSKLAWRLLDALRKLTTNGGAPIPRTVAGKEANLNTENTKRAVDELLAAGLIEVVRVTGGNNRPTDVLRLLTPSAGGSPA